MQVQPQRMSSRRALLAAALSLCAAALAASPSALPSGAAHASAAHAAAAPYGEYEVKAAFIYNFARFVEWPPEAFDGPAASLGVCLLGADQFGGALEGALQGKSVHGRSLEVRRLRGEERVQSCNILFVAASEADRLRSLLLRLGDAPILTVGESSDFARAGGIINFVLEENRVRFEVNAGAAERAGLRISSKLLGLARVVTGGRG